MAAKEGVDVRLYTIIYEAVADVRAAMEGMLEPTYREQTQARVEIRQIFNIAGVGTIAEELAPKCKALGMKVVGVSSAKRKLEGFDAMFGREELAQAVKEWDYFVLLTPFTPGTKNIVDTEIFAAMKPSSFFVNLARGGVVDEDALLDALKEKRIAGAALDVFAKEPLPEDSPFWDMENVIVTQHQGGFFDGYPGFALPVVEENMRKYLAGDLKAMINVVKR